MNNDIYAEWLVKRKKRILRNQQDIIKRDAITNNLTHVYYTSLFVIKMYLSY